LRRLGFVEGQNLAIDRRGFASSYPPFIIASNPALTSSAKADMAALTHSVGVSMYPKRHNAVFIGL
jgi:hypothetical protein